MFFSRKLLLFVCCLLGGCFSIPQNSKYAGPPERPQELEEYYKNDNSYTGFTEDLVAEKELFFIKQITISNHAEPILIDYFQRKEPNDNLILVFPALGGKPIIETHFAKYLSRRGFDTAIVRRNDAFKQPENVDKIEDIFRSDVRRDRVALDFFQKEKGKKAFGAFGLSRGGINVAITAGVDKRLQYNVIVLGGADIVGMFKDSDQRRIKKYRKTVMQQKGITEPQFYEFLAEKVKTDPKFLARYMDARNTLLILSMFDKTVPVKYGMKLREEIGNPRTVFLFADHYTGLFYTNYLNWLPPSRELSIFPHPYIENEALDFYNRSFGVKKSSEQPLLLRVLQAPFNLVGRALFAIF